MGSAQLSVLRKLSDAFLASSIFMSAATSAFSLEVNEPARLSELRERTAVVEYRPEDEGAAKGRADAVSQAAFSWGSQEGLYWRYQQIQGLLESKAQELHTIFDFAKFIVDGKMLMPSVIEAERIYEQLGPDSARTVKVSYTLDKGATIIPKQPTWFDYLVRSVDKPVEPHPAVFPRTENEVEIWNEQLSAGWSEGVAQANEIFEYDLRLLQKEIVGRYRFKKLYSMGVVSLPSVAQSHYGSVTYEDGRVLNVNDIIYQIESKSDFTDIDKWKPYVRADAGGRFR